VARGDAAAFGRIENFRKTVGQALDGATVLFGADLSDERRPPGGRWQPSPPARRDSGPLLDPYFCLMSLLSARRIALCRNAQARVLVRELAARRWLLPDGVSTLDYYRAGCDV
jgi:hypothetical protein